MNPTKQGLKPFLCLVLLQVLCQVLAHESNKTRIETKFYSGHHVQGFQVLAHESNKTRIETLLESIPPMAS